MVSNTAISCRLNCITPALPTVITKPAFPIEIDLFLSHDFHLSFVGVIAGQRRSAALPYNNVI